MIASTLKIGTIAVASISALMLNSLHQEDTSGHIHLEASDSAENIIFSGTLGLSEARLGHIATDHPQPREQKL